jgi:hypothetical protein
MMVEKLHKYRIWLTYRIVGAAIILSLVAAS